MRLGPGEPAAGSWRVEPVAALVQMLLAVSQDRSKPTAGTQVTARPRVVAVDGRSAGGKTTVAGLLLAALPGAQVVHTDDVAWHHSFFDWASLMIEGVLRPVFEGKAVRYRPPAWDERGRAGAIEVAVGAPMLVIEGVGAARRELLPFVDAVVWVQSDLAEAQERGIVRDGGTEAARQFWNEWAAEEIVFLADQKPWEQATVVVCGTPHVALRPDEVLVAQGWV